MSDLISEVENADWELGVVYTYVLGVEIFDQRLSDGEYRLLHLLRIRASGGRNNFVSQETLAKDLNVHEKTIATRMANLKANGYVACKSRGFGAPVLKTIISMKTRYDEDILKMSKKDMYGSDRTEELLKRLHCIDNAADRPLGAKTLPCDSVDENALHRERKRSLIGSENAPSWGAKTLPEVYQAKEIKIEVDSNGRSSARAENEERTFRRIGHNASGDTYDQDTGEVLGGTADLIPDSEITEPEEISQNSPPKVLSRVVPAERPMGASRTAQDAQGDDRPSIATIQGSMIQVAARAAQKGQEQIEKSRVQKLKDERSGLAEERRRLKEEARIENQTSGSKFYHWAMGEFQRYFPQIRTGKWKPREFSQLKDLVSTYDGDEPLVRKAWSYCCENWEALTKKLKIADSAPTIGFLLAFRERIFPLIQSQKTSRYVIERTSEKKKIGEW